MMFFGATHVSGCKNGGHPECKMEHVSDKTIRHRCVAFITPIEKKYKHERLVSRRANKVPGDYPHRLNLQRGDMAHQWLI